MKKIALILATLVAAVAVQAAPVDPTRAHKAAENLLGKAVVDVTPKDFSGCYLFAGADGVGFVLLTDDDRLRPLLALSPDGLPPVGDLPPNLAQWLDAYQRDITAIKALDLPPSAETAAEWEMAALGTPKRVIAGNPVAPLLASVWDQSPYYNDWCPLDTAAGQRAVTGCTATATAQVMRYWGHPAQARGFHSYLSKLNGVLAVDYDTSAYRWDLMPNRLTIVSPLDQRRAVAKLCYEVGVSMDMDYSAAASGAYAHSGGMLQRFSAELALENHFYYNPGMYNAYKEAVTDDEWVDLISDELNAGRPLIYTGSSSAGGHAFVVDGYNQAGLFHVNWGWGNIGNGYFTLSNLAMGTQGQPGYSPFNEMNEALINVHPITPNESVSTVALVSADPSRGSVVGSGTYPVNSPRVLLHAVPAPGYRFSHWASGDQANPIFFFPTVDHADTAYFVPLSADTLGYAASAVPNFDTVFALAHCEWGIRIPAERIPEGKALHAVRNFVYTGGQYVLRIYQGDLPETPLYEDVLDLATYGWHTITLPSALNLDPAKPLWVTFATDNINYAASITPYTGHPDGSWILHGDTWEQIDTTSTGYYTWAMGAILGELNAIVAPQPDGLVWQADGRTLAVSNPAALQVSLFDIMGRRLAAPSALTTLAFTVPAPGVYLLKADGRPAQRVIVH